MNQLTDKISQDIANTQLDRKLLDTSFDIEELVSNQLKLEIKSENYECISNLLKEDGIVLTREKVIALTICLTVDIFSNE